MDLNLNEEPSESRTDLIGEMEPLLENFGSSHDHIEERIRHLESIVSRMGEQETTRPLQRETPSLVADEHPEATAGYIHERSRIEIDMVSKTDRTYLIAKALGMEKTTAVTSKFFDCNTCLSKAEDPILTCCGHLFCWSCFYLLPCSYLNVKECPVCDGEVTDNEVIPIYGNGDTCNANRPKAKESGIYIPPRPCAKRVESVRQNITDQAPLLPTHETIQDMRRALDAIELQTLPRGNILRMNIVRASEDPEILPIIPLRMLIPPFPPSPGMAADSSDLPDGTFDSYIDTSNVRRNRRRSSRIADRNSSRNMSSELAPVTSPEEFLVSARVTETSPPLPSASSSRRRAETQTPDLGDGPRTRSRRRRLR